MTEQQSPLDDEIDLLTIREVADLLRVHTRTIERLERAGKLPAFKLNAHTIRFHRRDVVAFVRANTRYRSSIDDSDGT